MRDTSVADILEDIRELEQYRGFSKARDDEIDEQVRLCWKMIESINVMKEVSSWQM